jgi:hypothetical protein
MEERSIYSRQKCETDMDKYNDTVEITVYVVLFKKKRNVPTSKYFKIPLFLHSFYQFCVMEGKPRNCFGFKSVQEVGQLYE